MKCRRAEGHTAHRKQLRGRRPRRALPRPLRAGDDVEIRATVISRGRGPRRIAVEAWRLVPGGAGRDYALCGPSALVARGTMVSVTPKSAGDAKGSGGRLI